MCISRNYRLVKTDFSNLPSTTAVQPVLLLFLLLPTSNSYTMGCPPVRGDNPRALASGLSYVQVDKHGMTILYHQHHSRPCTSRDSSY